MGDRPQIDFVGLAARLLDNAAHYVELWLPGGTQRGHEYVCGGLRGGAGTSCSVNLVNGKWADFAGNEKGGDLLSLYAAARGIKQGAAALELTSDLGWAAPVPASAPAAKPKKRATMWRPVMPVPVPAHVKRPKFVWGFKDATAGRWVDLTASAQWAYWFNGDLLGYVARFERIDSSGAPVKETLPLTWCVDESDDRGLQQWRWKQWDAPRPLYVPSGVLSADVDRLVLAVEGEKCAQAAHHLVGDVLDVVSWPGGCKAWPKAGWGWLAGRRVVFWADCDSKRVPLTAAEKSAGADEASKPFLDEAQQPGRVAMLGIAAHLADRHGCQVWHCATPAPGVVADGWDVADAIAQGWDRDRVLAFVRAAVDAPAPGVAGVVAGVVGDAMPPWVDELPPLVDDGAASSLPPSPGAAAPPAPTRGKGPAKAGRPPKKIPDETWDAVDLLTQRFALIYGTDTAWDRLEEMILRVPAMRLAFGSDAVKLWLGRSSRVMVRPTDLVFEPGRDVRPPQINMYSGLGLEPVPCTAADVAPMLALLRHLCSESADTSDGCDEVMDWVLRWQALPLQQLGTKLQTACVFHGAQGTGKNLYWDVWRDLFGVFGITVGQTELEDKFNGWISRKLAIIGDEVVSRQEMYHTKNRLKLVVTQEDKFPIRGMQQETRWESNHANVVFLSNESQPLALEERDRRYMVVYTPLEAEADVYEAVRVFKAAGGAAKWLHYLLTYDLAGFTAHTKPLMTRAKEDLIEAGWLSPHRFAHEWLGGLLELPVLVCSVAQLYRAFRRWCDLNGERFPPPQAKFTRDVTRWTAERVVRNAAGVMGLPMLSTKAINLKNPVGALKTVRCWLPMGAGIRPDSVAAGMSEGQWACESVDEFGVALNRFCRRPDVEQPDGAQP